MKFAHPVLFRTGPYEPDEFFRIAKGLEKVPEGGERCFKCFDLRLRGGRKGRIGRPL